MRDCVRVAQFYTAMLHWLVIGIALHPESQAPGPMCGIHQAMTAARWTMVFWPPEEPELAVQYVQCVMCVQFIYNIYINICQ